MDGEGDKVGRGSSQENQGFSRVRFSARSAVEGRKFPETHLFFKSLW